MPLLSDFSCDITSQTVGIQYLHGHQVSILVSRSSRKFFTFLFAVNFEYYWRLFTYASLSVHNASLIYCFTLTEKYRIQSDSFAALWLPILELLRRLRQYYKHSSNGETLKCNFSSNLPLQEYFAVIDKYFEVGLLHFTPWP